MTTPRAESRWADSQLIGTVVRSVWQWQLVVGFSTVAVALGVALLDPQLFDRLPLLGGLALICLTTTFAIVMPWARHRDLVVVLPFVDTVAIGVLSLADQTLGYLWVIPVAWLATYYSMAAVVSALALVFALQLSRWWVPGAPLTSPLETMIVLLGLGFLGIAMNQGARRTRAFRLLIQRQSRQLDRAVSRMSAHEDRANGLFDTISTALARVDDRGEIDLANAAYRRLYAYDNDDYRHPPRAVEYDGYRGRALPRDMTSTARAARGERVDRELIWIYDAGGDWRALSMSIRGRSVRTETGDDATVAIIQLDDVTDTELERREQRATTSAVSHELRNPLTVIVGHTDLLLDRPDLTPGQREHAAVIEGAAQRMLALTRSLLDSHRTIEAADEFDLSAVAGATTDAFAPAAAASDITLRVHISDELPVSGDGFGMRQVVDNLISNAIKYTPRGGFVDVDAARDGDRAVLRVTDSGIGIAPGDVDKVFVPYFRARSATASGIAGTGLGMSIARKIVEANNGTIALESELGTGTTVTLRLPLTRAHREHLGGGDT
ncbi:sensor histidine kinase [Microbacterium sp. VKM Ac-2870]|uniref:sensor histidine kinase n=1 Tax=Microbacterium sp. VKM Ac-2870 TaxID=2783825 RepID=UPI00188CFB9D|nr:HAMP domain-containing sensor histidine kinase [Microbacterium sp. VKM Ac-2870]MBF4561441.1 sensor histidine kinase [Microbacterium sp. VKM Ac-2870]